MIKFKKIFQLTGWGIVFAMFLSVLVGLFNSIIQPRLIEYLMKRVTLDLDMLMDLLLVVFLGCSCILIFLVYWLIWENKQLKTIYREYLSKVVCPDYYKQATRIKFDNFVAGQLDAYKEKELEVGEDLNIDRIGTAGDEDDEYAEYTDLEVDPEEIAGLKDGAHKTYYKNGNLKKEITCRDGKLNGPYLIYYREGRLHQERNYKDGMLHGLFKAYDDDGILYFEKHYKKGEQHGEDRIYNRNGALQYLDIYEEGKLINRKTYDDGGELKFDQDISDEE